MQTADKKQRSTMDNIVIVSAIIEQRRIEKSNTSQPLAISFADAVKCFDKLCLQDCIIELAKLDYSKNDLEILYKLNEITQVKINTPYGDTENIARNKRSSKTGDNMWAHYVLCINSKSK